MNAEEQIAFLKAIHSNRDDDLPRLVYADWLDENGQSERADFIRTQIALFRLPKTRPLLPIVSKVSRVFSPDLNEDKVFHAQVNKDAFERLVRENTNKDVDWYWPLSGGASLRGTATIIHRAPVREETQVYYGGPPGFSYIEVTLVPTTPQDDHWSVRKRQEELTTRQNDLWTKAIVQGHYALLPLLATFVVLDWEDLDNADTGLVDLENSIIGLVRRGMVEGVHLPLDQWTVPHPQHCKVCCGDGQIGVQHGPNEWDFEECGHCPTLGQLLRKEYPLAEVRLSDKEPFYSPMSERKYHWYAEETDTEELAEVIHPESDLPPSVFNRLSKGKCTEVTQVRPYARRAYYTKEEAWEDLTQALFSLAPIPSV